MFVPRVGVMVLTSGRGDAMSALSLVDLVMGGMNCLSAGASDSMAGLFVIALA